MSKSFDRYIDKNLENIFYEKKEISFQEYERLPQAEKDNLVFENNQYYKKIPIDIDKNDVHTGLMIEIYKQLYMMNKKQNAIKNILIFFTLLTILSLLLSLLGVMVF